MTAAKKTAAKPTRARAQPKPKTYTVTGSDNVQMVTSAYHTGYHLGMVEGAQKERRAQAKQAAIACGLGMVAYTAILIARRVRR